jgi:hypothetical protein
MNTHAIRDRLELNCWQTTIDGRIGKTGGTRKLALQRACCDTIHQRADRDPHKLPRHPPLECGGAPKYVE